MEAPLRTLTRANRHHNGLRLTAWAVYLLTFGPVLVGLAGTILPGLNYLPALGGHELSLKPFQALWQEPGLISSLRLTLISGLGATFLSVLITFYLLACLYRSRFLQGFARSLPLLNSLPHAALAIGLAFLIAPSGFVARAFSPWLTGWDVPPDIASLRDPYGIGLMIGLALKEVPFLVLVGLTALSQIPAHRHWVVARSLGYSPTQAWTRAILPLLYPLMRLPVYAVLAYSLSVVDMAAILAPSSPPPLAVWIVRWSNDPDLTGRFTAAAGACLQLGLVLTALAAWRFMEIILHRLARRQWWHGHRGGGVVDRVRRINARLLVVNGLTIYGVILVCLAIASFAGPWSFPATMPASFQTQLWVRLWPALWPPLLTTALVAALTSLLATALAVGFLEYRYRIGRPIAQRTLSVIALPLLIPQIAFLFGLQILLTLTGWDGTLGAVVAFHLIFVLPYAFLSITDAYQRFDIRYLHTARSLGAGLDRSFWHVRLPMMRGPFLICLAIGFAVSTAQYLPTLFAGAGRVVTITTEAVSLSSGYDRRSIAAYGLTQALLPLAVYGLVWWFTRRSRSGSPL